MAEWCAFCVALGLVILVLGCSKSNLRGPSLCLHCYNMACRYFWVLLKSCVVYLSHFRCLPLMLDAEIPFYLLLLFRGDIEVHPGPSSFFPCSVCHQEVADSEYASIVWNPHTSVHVDTHILEMVQNRAARWICASWNLVIYTWSKINK